MVEAQCRIWGIAVSSKYVVASCVSVGCGMPLRRQELEFGTKGVGLLGIGMRVARAVATASALVLNKGYCWV